MTTEKTKRLTEIAPRLFTALRRLSRIFAEDSYIPEVAEARAAIHAVDPAEDKAIASKKQRVRDLVAAFQKGDDETIKRIVAEDEAEAKRDKLDRT